MAALFGNLETADDVFKQTAASDEAQREELGLTPGDAALFQRLAAPILFSGPPLRSRESVSWNRLGKPALWAHGISGDLPIALMRIGVNDNLDLVRNVLRGHAYWRVRGIVADLILLQEEGVDDELRRQLENEVHKVTIAELLERPGGVFLRDASRISADDATLLEAAARLLLRGVDGRLAVQLDRSEADAPPLPPPLLPIAGPQESASESSHQDAVLLFDNGLGGFTADGREYVITLRAGERPPSPWINVIANPNFGCLVTEAGSGYTWAGNSQMNRLTPWSNDPVTDPPGEAVYLRDDNTGEFWSPTPAPCGGKATTIIRHRQGYSVFTQTSHHLEQELLVVVSPTDQIKMIRLRVRSMGSRLRRLSATFYAEWVLGSLRDQAAEQVVCSVDAETGALFATNAWAGDFAGQVAFATVVAVGTESAPYIFTTDRTEFLGREGSSEAPAALSRSRLSGRTDGLVDPCAALMMPVELPSGGEKEIVFVLGQAGTPEEARRLVRAYTASGRVQMVLEEVRELWDGILETIQIRNPEPAVDLMMNRWLIYQVLACRMWGRSAFYQSDGAFGFRDQLQDVMAIVYGAPGEAREQILRASARQFEGSVYEHCERSLECGFKLGTHGLPLMGTGDWNDGMNKVGAGGKGESVWNGWLMFASLREFAGVAERRGDGARAFWCRERANLLRLALEEHAWDGLWYRRAYFDDGTPLGSATNDECRINSIAQSWAVISGAGDPDRARQAMMAVEEQLVRDTDGLILLFTPPFDRGRLDPGYIKGYVPGIRENGGQYTHAATWVVLATALLGNGNRAAQLFDLINPVRHASSPEGVVRYKVEPYVVCANVYGVAPHTGRGGWAWYTGSAAWLYRVGLEAILGFRLQGKRLEFNPCVPPGWAGYEVTYRHRSATYHILVDNSAGLGRGIRGVSVDGRKVRDSAIELVDDGIQHTIKITLGL